MTVFIVYLDDQKTGTELVAICSDRYAARKERDAVLHICGKPGADAWFEEWEVDGKSVPSYPPGRNIVSLPYPLLKKEPVTI